MKKLLINKKLVFTSLLGLIIIISTFHKPVVASTTFTDLERVQSWAGDSIDYLVHKGVIHGIGNNKFNPSGQLTRGESAKMLALIMPLEVNINEKTDFADAKNHWSSPYIHALQQQAPGVINGFLDGTFQPNGFITREQMAKMIAIAYAFEENEGNNDMYRFNDVSGWATDYIQILANHGIIQGKTRDRFAPKEHVNRAEAAAIIHRAETVYHLTPREFEEKVVIEQDGIQFEVMLNHTYDKLYANVKVTNISELTIPYIGRNGCDPGLSVNLFAYSDGQKVQVGSKMWNPLISCPQMIVQHFLDPGETIQTFEVLILTANGFTNNHYVNVTLHNGLLNDSYPYSPIEIEIPIVIE